MSLQWQLSYQPVTEHDSLRPRRSDGQLKRRVKVMLLFVRAMNNLSSPDDQKARVTEVTCVQPVTPPVQDHDACCAASCKTTEHFRDPWRMTGLNHPGNQEKDKALWTNNKNSGWRNVGRPECYYTQYKEAGFFLKVEDTSCNVGQRCHLVTASQNKSSSVEKDCGQEEKTPHMQCLAVAQENWDSSEMGPWSHLTS